MYGTTDATCGPRTFATYFSKDLEQWSGPIAAFRADKDFWGQYHFWAPEVHRYNGRYCMFANFKADNIRRATQILVADRPRGPFRPHSDGPVTPRDWECLDGTLFVDEQGEPWIVYCHEWVQTYDGEICAQRLTRELDRSLGEPAPLFRASKAPWIRKPRDMNGFITDGPFLHRSADGQLLMLWSSFGEEGYAQALARSETGKLAGPWKQDSLLLFSKDGGHGMLFTTFEGQLTLSLHQPNSHGNERPHFLPVRERAGHLTVDWRQ